MRITKEMLESLSKKDREEYFREYFKVEIKPRRK
jgi:hypothetical protein